MKVLLLDCETTGLVPGNDRITELGMMITSLDFKTIHESYNKLVWDDTYPAITSEITEITGITEDMLRGNSILPHIMCADFGTLLFKHNPKYIIAYNAVFDKSFVESELTRNRQGTDTHWLCAMTDVKSNYKYKSWKLMHLALDYGVPVDPNELHRAINDVELMRKMLIASGVHVDDMYEYKNSPAVYVKACVKKPWDDDGVSTTKAKLHGFAWEKAKGDSKIFNRTWVKKIKECELEATRAALPFETTILL